jgi:hypothetical protein
LDEALKDQYTIKEIKPADFQFTTKLGRMVVELLHQAKGDPKTIKAIGEQAAHALRDFIIHYKRVEDIGT